MPVITRIPKGSLAKYVEMIWFSNNYVPSSSKERVLPNGACQIIINLGHKKFRHFTSVEQKIQSYNLAVITGIHIKPVFLDSYSRVSTMGAVLKPGAVSALFNIPAVEFRGEVVTLGDVFPGDILELRQRLIHASTVKATFASFESFLSNNLNVEFQPNPAIIHSFLQLKQNNGLPTIAEVRRGIGYSRRRFSQLFKEQVGATPKQYARICRFQQTLRMIRDIDSPDWPDLALRCGYYDQAHLIHDFSAIAGLSPTAYQQNQTEALNHLPA